MIQPLRLQGRQQNKLQRPLQKATSSDKAAPYLVGLGLGKFVLGRWGRFNSINNMLPVIRGIKTPRTLLQPVIRGIETPLQVIRYFFFLFNQYKIIAMFFKFKFGYNFGKIEEFTFKTSIYYEEVFMQKKFGSRISLHTY